MAIAHGQHFCSVIGDPLTYLVPRPAVMRFALHGGTASGQGIVISEAESVRRIVLIAER